MVASLVAPDAPQGRVVNIAHQHVIIIHLGEKSGDGDADLARAQKKNLVHNVAVSLDSGFWLKLSRTMYYRNGRIEAAPDVK